MKRTFALGAAWTASAAAAVGLGFLAVSLVDASADPGTSPVAATASSSDTSASDTSASDTSTPTPSPSATSATSALGQTVTPGGTIYTDCASGSPVNAAVPAAGWSVDDSNAVGEIEFRAGDRKIEVHVTCEEGGVISGTHDDSSRQQGTPSPSSSAVGDDHGGHGADDPAGDDSSGRSGGGHGKDG